jgi:hypothetical protein
VATAAVVVSDARKPARERGAYEHAIDLHRFSGTIWLELEDRGKVERSLNYVGPAVLYLRIGARQLCRGAERPDHILDVSDARTGSSASA